MKNYFQQKFDEAVFVLFVIISLAIISIYGCCSNLHEEIIKSNTRKMQLIDKVDSLQTALEKNEP